MKYINDTTIDRISGKTGDNLRAEKKIRLTIKSDESNRDIPWEGGINGHFFRIPRNIEVLVPESIAELIATNEQITISSNNRTKAYKNGNGKKLST